MSNFWITRENNPFLWELIWRELEKLEGDKVCPNNGEIWEYMGSQGEGNRDIHTFRHRWHPATGRQEYRRVTTPGSIAKSAPKANEK